MTMIMRTIPYHPTFYSNININLQLHDRTIIQISVYLLYYCTGIVFNLNVKKERKEKFVNLSIQKVFSSGQVHFLKEERKVFHILEGMMD